MSFTVIKMAYCSCHGVNIQKKATEAVCPDGPDVEFPELRRADYTDKADEASELYSVNKSLSFLRQAVLCCSISPSHIWLGAHTHCQHLDLLSCAP